ncbi:MAG: twin-arginine translocase TatA/TatE family subunit [Dehalococcoidia bacterium]|nr:twin-arginine translocase TatA/TatE family subunit [Dehalococcoidia bacterium]
MFKSFGWVEILVILGVLMLLFGGSKLPQMGKSIGKSIREFKSGISGADEESKDKPQPPKSSSTPPSADGGAAHRH